MPAPPTVAAQKTEDLGKLYAEFWEENLKLNPIIATFAGDPRYNGELPNFLSEEFEAQDRAFHQKYLDRARAIVGSQGIDALTGQDRLSYEIFTLNRESALEEFKFPERLLPIDQFRTSPIRWRSSAPAPARSRSSPSRTTRTGCVAPRARR